MDPEVEARARAIVAEASRARKRLPRWVWGAALVMFVVCTGALAYAWFAERDTVAVKPLAAQQTAHSSGLGIGLLVGLGLGIAIGSVLALRRGRDGGA